MLYGEFLNNKGEVVFVYHLTSLILGKDAILGKKPEPEKGHKLDIKYLEIPEIFSQNRTIFDDILAKNVT